MNEEDDEARDKDVMIALSVRAERGGEEGGRFVCVDVSVHSCVVARPTALPPLRHPPPQRYLARKCSRLETCEGA